jgi:hypothetical protein
MSIPIPIKISATVSSRRIHLKWELDAATTYLTYDISYNGVIQRVSGINLTEYTLTSLINNRPYYISIRAGNEYGYVSEYSYSIGPVIPVEHQLLPAITDVSVNIVNNRLRLQWGYDVGVQAYAIFRNIDDTVYVPIKYIVDNTYEEVIEAGKKYKYKIAKYLPAEGDIISQIANEVSGYTQFVGEVVEPVVWPVVESKPDVVRNEVIMPGLDMVSFMRQQGRTSGELTNRVEKIQKGVVVMMRGIEKGVKVEMVREGEVLLGGILKI